MKHLRNAFILILLLLSGPFSLVACGKVSLEGDWSRASRQVAGIAPAPALHRDAIVQVYAARAFKWRGAFAVHTWIAVKPADAPTYTTYEVMGWNLLKETVSLRDADGQDRTVALEDLKRQTRARGSKNVEPPTSAH